MNKLTSFLQLLNGERTDRPVWTADLSYWISGRRQDGTADPAWATEIGYLELHRDLGVMPYYFYDKFWAGEAVYDGDVRIVESRVDDQTIRTLMTPVGNLEEISVFLPDSCCQAVVSHFVENEADLDVLLYALDHRRWIPVNLDDYNQRRRLWAQYDGLPCLALPRSPLPALIYEWAGMQNLALLMVDCPDKVNQALGLMARQEQPVLDAVCALAPPLVHFPDNLSSDNLTGYYDEFMRPCHVHRLDRLHAAGVKTAVHLDGAVRGLLPKLIDAGFDAIEALTPQPAGDMTVDAMAQVAEASGVILWGGVPGAMFAPPYTWDAMRRHVGHVLDVWRDRPFILGVADQVPPNGDIEFCRKIHEML